MNARVETEYKRLDKSKLKKRKRSIISSEEALKDIIPINWNSSISEGANEKNFVVCK